MRRARLIAVVCLSALGLTGECMAQSTPAGRYELSAGVRWNGPITVNDAVASETAPGGSTSPLFKAHTTLNGSFGATAGFGVRLSRTLRAEMSAAYGTEQLSSQILADAEVVGATTVRTPVTRVSIEGGILAQRSRWRARRVQPFATAGVGYLREMYEGRTLIESGSAIYAGGGLYYVRASTRTRPGRLEATGLRVDLRANVRRGGVASATNVHTAPEVMATLFARF